jgi:hypothetical protein
MNRLYVLALVVTLHSTAIAQTPTPFTPFTALVVVDANGKQVGPVASVDGYVYMGIGRYDPMLWIVEPVTPAGYPPA